MADVVKTISDALEATIQTVLPDYKPLDYSYFPEKNTFYKNDERFGVTVGAGISVNTITKAITIDQIFNVVLTNSYASHSDDAGLKKQIFALFDALNTIYIEVFNTKLSLPDLVYFVGPLSWSDPLIDAEQSIIIQSMALNIQYRTLLI